MIRWLLVLAAAVCPAAAQTPKVGDINFYGLRKLAPEKILTALGLKTGIPLPSSKGDLEERLELMPGVAAARVEAVCCDGPNAILFIGVEERGAPHFDTRPAPAGSARLPEEVMAAWHEYLSAAGRAAQFGNAAEDLTAGESHLADIPARMFEDRLTGLAVEHVNVLRDVLRSDTEPDERAVAAAVIGYAPDKDQAIKDLQFAMQDVEPAVRANAARAMMAIAVLAQKRPDLGLRIEPTWMVAMLNSIVLSDRQLAARALVTLTEQRNAATLELIRERALPALVDMARWKTLRYALPAYLLVGRANGVAEQELMDQWEHGDRETAIERAVAPKGRRGK